ncbi:peptidyl-tRNA hydrolase 2, mitochondrial isoform X1 [Amborella trichopoda]|uniref:peptidyl-tRNA hydrolase 2, mitochondrial isoform X1 n=1 Tax=Amborella trichopoda TaxID=13333 RepID=UPI0005D3A9DF|nr:peptidyl-tRNA hydrolase 2, mitochondrial isoform X1 [Amborella trichopoda]XP_020528696.1 peptidyl-tRNA hydrolase 2, mitochondrial isoform X1 [Amborella trichopoda]XP_020528697.1 peptidyl-tRNA hydrolase 2, mitochondrial isoform X1 [Amborella trichopoda]|eukprot:XP_011626719.1 peptidyl-tRNA hydrolase 2, mitochondrial isoform X1 [Amborella trichopoda]
MFGFWRSSSPHVKSEKRQEPWLASSLKPENFVPGLLIGFLLGLLLELPKISRTSPALRLPSTLSKKKRLLSPSCDEELKMVLVVRQDLKMGAGKIASQCAHAATGLYAELMRSHRSLLSQWEQCGQPKIVVTCKNQQEMNKLRDAADNIGLPTFIVADAGRTQVSVGSKTVLAIGPVGASTVHLELQMVRSTLVLDGNQSPLYGGFPGWCTICLSQTMSGNKAAVDSITGKLRLL